MENQNIANLLDNTSDKVPRFITKKWIEVHDQSGETYNTKQVRLKHQICVITVMHILLLKELLLFVLIERDRDEMNRQVILKNNAPFISCISKINDALIENAEDLDIVMPMYNLLEYSKNYSKTSGSLWNYYRDKLADETNGDNGPNKNVINSKSFKYKTSITRSNYNVAAIARDYDANKEGTHKIEILVLLKH